MANSKERDHDDWVQLFREVDPKFTVKNIKTPPGSDLSMVEVVWDEGTTTKVTLTNGLTNGTSNHSTEDHTPAAQQQPALPEVPI